MNDQVPEKWRAMFTNEEWIQHDFVVKGSWLMGGLAVLVHLVIWMTKPWLTPGA
jgi:light-harvesting complex 1 beta chain